MTWMQLAHGLRLDPVAKGLPEAPVALLHDAADPAATPSPFAARGAWRPVDISSTRRAASQSIDAALYLFALCRHLQTIALDRCGIDCLSDAEGAGRLPEAACRMLGTMVCELVKDASARSQPETARRTVTVTLRRRGAFRRQSGGIRRRRDGKQAGTHAMFRDELKWRQSMSVAGLRGRAGAGFTRALAGWTLATATVLIALSGPPLTGESIPTLMELRHNILMLDREFERLSIPTAATISSAPAQSDVWRAGNTQSKAPFRGGAL